MSRWSLAMLVLWVVLAQAAPWPSVLRQTGYCRSVVERGGRRTIYCSALHSGKPAEWWNSTGSCRWSCRQ